MTEINNRIEPKMLDKCRECGHLFEEHDWGAYAKKQAGCCVTRCKCSNFISQPLNDKELREKLARIIYEGYLPVHSNLPRYWHQLNDFQQEHFRNIADEILALPQPKIEEARRQIRAELNAEISIELGSRAFHKGKILGTRQERERITEWGSDACIEHYKRGMGVHKKKRECRECWQALKGGER